MKIKLDALGYAELEEAEAGRFSLRAESPGETKPRAGFIHLPGGGFLREVRPFPTDHFLLLGRSCLEGAMGGFIHFPN